jgi:hypothetical protein
MGWRVRRRKVLVSGKEARGPVPEGGGKLASLRERAGHGLRRRAGEVGAHGVGHVVVRVHAVARVVAAHHQLAVSRRPVAPRVHVFERVHLQTRQENNAVC